MRIAMLGWEFPPFISGGLGVHCYELTRALASMGHEIDFYLPASGKPLASPHANIRLIEVAPTVLRPYFMFTKKGRMATYGDGLLAAVNSYNDLVARMVEENHKTRHYDLIHAHDWLTCTGAISAAGRICRPHVQTFHSTEFDRTSTPWDSILAFESRGAKDALRIIAVSNRTKDMVARLGADPARIRVVYNAVDADKYRHGREGRPLPGIDSRGKKIVLFLGRLTEQKGPVQFLHAAKKVLEKDPNVLFLVAGTGELLPLLINLSLELGLESHVRFLGYLPDEDQKRIYAASDLYVMPSTSEPFGITALEAIASGTPVILSKTSGASEVVRSAVRVDFWDIKGMAQKIMAILHYAPLKEAMVNLGGRDLAPLTWAHTASQTEAVYQDALANYKP